MHARPTFPPLDSAPLALRAPYAMSAYAPSSSRPYFPAPAKPLVPYASTSSPSYPYAPSRPSNSPADVPNDPLLHLILSCPPTLILPSGPTLRIAPASSTPSISVHPISPHSSSSCIDIDFCPAWPDNRRVTARVLRGDWEGRRVGVREVREAALRAWEGVRRGVGWRVWEVVRRSDCVEREEEPVEDEDDDSGESTISWFSSESDSSV